MCISPIRLANGTLVACRGCQLCKDNRINDFIGRCIAEQTSSDLTLALTLTYRGDVPGSVVLDYRHVQLMLKSIRNAGHAVRYIVAGEYGETKGRAHWHIILFFKGTAPDLKLERRIDWPHWPHGFVYAQTPDYRGFRYAIKYAVKSQEPGGKSHAFSMSKKPPLGYEFFMRLAADLVSAGLPLHSPEYSYSDVRNRKGEPRRYWLQGRMRELFLEEYDRLWRLTYNSEPPWTEFLVSGLYDPIARAEMADDFQTLARDIQARAPDPEKVRTKIFIEDADLRPKRSLGMLLLQDGTGGIVEAFEDKTATLTTGKDQWLISEKETAVQLSQNAVLPNSTKLLVSQWLNQKWKSRA